MPRGKKVCPKCKAECSSRSKSCSCGFQFKAGVSKKKAKPSFFKERKEFIGRMLGGQKPSNYKLDMMVATKVFANFENDIDFLSKVKPPFKFDDSIKYLLTKEGVDYLKKKSLEFYYNPSNSEKMIDHNEKTGEDREVSRVKSLREFLNE